MDDLAREIEKYDFEKLTEDQKIKIERQDDLIKEYNDIVDKQAGLGETARVNRAIVEKYEERYRDIPYKARPSREVRLPQEKYPEYSPSKSALEKYKGIQPEYRTEGSYKDSEYKPTDYKPTDYKPSEYKPTEYKPSEYKPEDYQSPEYKPSEYKPTDYKPTKYKPTEYKPTDYKPTEYKLTEYKPTEYKPQKYTPEKVIPKYTIPYTQPTYQPVIPKPSLPRPVKWQEKVKLLSKYQIDSAIAWKQGFMYHMIYPPWGQKDAIHTRKPIEGVKYYTGPGAAYRSVVAKYGSRLPDKIVYKLGIQTITFSPKGMSEQTSNVPMMQYRENPEEAKHYARKSRKRDLYDYNKIRSRKPRRAAKEVEPSISFY